MIKKLANVVLLAVLIWSFVASAASAKSRASSHLGGLYCAPDPVGQCVNNVQVGCARVDGECDWDCGFCGVFDGNCACFQCGFELD